MRPLNTAQLNEVVETAVVLSKVVLTRVLLYMACCGLALGQSARTLAQAGQEADVGAVAATEVKPTEVKSTGVKSTEVRALTVDPIVEVAPSEPPDSPGTSWARAQDASPQQNSSSQSAVPSTQPGNSPTTAAQDQTQNPQRPVGTAAAEAPKVNGVTAAQPAGVAIAPAKQRRVRTIVLKVGALIGAGVAVGAIVALTEATSSKPPGAH